MEIKIKSMKRDDWKDNEYIDHLVEELNASGANVVVGTFDKLINWSRANSLWPLCFGTSCCAIEFMHAAAARHDMARFGFEVLRNSPRQADLIMPGSTTNTSPISIILPLRSLRSAVRITSSHTSSVR